MRAIIKGNMAERIMPSSSLGREPEAIAFMLGVPFLCSLPATKYQRTISVSAAGTTSSNDSDAAPFLKLPNIASGNLSL